MQPLDPLDGRRWLDTSASGRRGRGRGRRRGGAMTGGRGRGRGGRPPKLAAGPSRMAENTDHNPYLKPKRSYTRRGGRPRGTSSSSTARGRRRGRRSTRPRQGGRAGAIPKESLLGSFNIISNNTSKTDTTADVSRSSGEEEEDWGLQPRERDYEIEAENNSSDENGEENGEMLADEYVESMPHQYAGEYMTGVAMDESEEEEEDVDNHDDDDADAEGFDEGMRYGHAREDDGAEMMDEDEEDNSDGAGDGDDNVDVDDEDDDGDDGGYSDYSD
jgi:hypothetical protein